MQKKELLEWIEQQIKNYCSASVSHAIEKTLIRLKPEYEHEET